MTREEFNSTKFTARSIFAYEGGIYDVVALHFPEGLLGLDMYNDTSDLTWVRCESGVLIEI